jgi:hypothetical protein
MEVPMLSIISTPTRRRIVRALAPLCGLMLAGGLVWQGSNAAFTATTNAPGNAWNAGTVNLTSNTGAAGAFVASGTARFAVSNIKPGDTGTACVTVRSTGTSPSIGRFYVQNVTGTIAPALAPQIKLTVGYGTLPNGTGVGTNIPAACTGAPAITNYITNIALTALPTSYAAAANSWTLAGGTGVTENRVYRITWSFDTTGTNAGDNLLQGRSAGADFVWEVQ